MVPEAPGVPVCAANHQFHKDCIQRWSDQAPTCPTCRAPLLETVLSTKQLVRMFNMKMNRAVVEDNVSKVLDLLTKDHPAFGCSLLDQVRKDESEIDVLSTAHFEITQIVTYAVRRSANKVLSMLQTMNFHRTGLSLFDLLLPGAFRVNLTAMLTTNFSRTCEIHHFDPVMAAKISVGTIHSVLLTFDARGGLLNTRNSVRNAIRMLLEMSLVDYISDDVLTPEGKETRRKEVLNLTNWLGKRTAERIEAAGGAWKRDTDRYATVLEDILHEVFGTLLISEFGEVASLEPEGDDNFDVTRFMTYYAEHADSRIRNNLVIGGIETASGSISAEAGYVLKAFLVAAVNTIPLKSAHAFRKNLQGILRRIMERMKLLERCHLTTGAEDDHEAAARITVARLRRKTTCAQLEGMIHALQPRVQERRIARMLD